MPILLVFLLTAACMPVEWPGPPAGVGPRGSAALTAAAVAAALGAAFAARTRVVRALRRAPDRRAGVAAAYGRVRRVLVFVNLTAAGLSVFAFGWGWAVRHSLRVGWRGESVLAPFAELAVPLPYFLTLFGCWLVHYDAERVLAAGGRGFRSRGAYVSHNLRQLALLAGLPVGLFVTQQTLVRFAPEETAEVWYRVASVAVVPVILLLVPLVIRPLLGLRPLPPGPTRDRLAALAARLRFRHADLLVWPTHGAVVNAMIVGLLPRVRYVVFTDRLLDELPADELDAVFGHEVGHARHGHLWYYTLFLGLSLSVLAALALYAEAALKARGVAFPDEYASWVILVPILPVAAYVFVAFGLLSRRCERQADVAGCRAVSCGDPACGGHDAGTAYPAGGTGLCPTGIRTAARALERVYHLNGHDGPDDNGPWTVGSVARGVAAWVRAWQHAPMPRRVAFLLSLLDDRGRERRFQRRLLVLRWALVLGLGAALVALGEAVGWRELLKVL